MEHLNRIKTPMAYVYMRDGFLFNEITEADLILEHFVAHNDLLLSSFAGALPCPVVVFAHKDTKQPGREIRDFMNTEDFRRVTKSLAVVADMGLSRTIINLFLKFARLPVPVKMFSTVEEALAWSQQYK